MRDMVEVEAERNDRHSKHRIALDLKHGFGVRVGHNVVIDENVKLGNRVFIGNNTVIRSGVRIGNDVTLGHLVLIERDTIIGDNVTIQSQCHITAEAIIWDYVYMGPGVVIINDYKLAVHGRGTPELKGPDIRRGVRIGARALIMPGVTIGAEALIGAGSVITKDVSAFEIWYGQQAEKRGMVSQEEKLRV